MNQNFLKKTIKALSFLVSFRGLTQKTLNIKHTNGEVRKRFLYVETKAICLLV